MAPLEGSRFIAWQLYRQAAPGSYPACRIYRVSDWIPGWIQDRQRWAKRAVGHSREPLVANLQTCHPTKRLPSGSHHNS
jgi:hypothetical protein